MAGRADAIAVRAIGGFKGGAEGEVGASERLDCRAWWDVGSLSFVLADGYAGRWTGSNGFARYRRWDVVIRGW